jgi:hypothetical protein
MNSEITNIDEQYIRWPVNENYLIYNTGKIYSLTSKRFLTQRVMGGYYHVDLSANNTSKPYRLHRLIAQYFVINDSPLINTIVNHKDSNKLNNHFSNLEWTTIKGNNIHHTKSKNYKRERKSYKVDQIDIVENKIITTFESTKDASSKLSVSLEAIRTRCLGKVKSNIRINGKFYMFQYNQENIINEIPTGSKQIEGLQNFYITDDGCVYSTRIKRFMKLELSSGYHVCKLKGKMYKVHRLVAKHYIPNDDPENKKIVNHLDSNRTNNHVSNLQWCTASENARHAIDIGNNTKCKRAVKQISLETKETINIFRSCMEASETCNIKYSALIKCCHKNINKEKNDILQGFRWEFVDTNIKPKVITTPEIPIALLPINTNTHSNKPILVMNDKGLLVSIFSSVKSAAAEMHINVSNIPNYCQGKAIPRNKYKWQYLKDNPEFFEYFSLMNINLD